MKKLFFMLLFGSLMFTTNSSYSQDIYSQTDTLSEELQAAYQVGFDIGFSYGTTNNESAYNSELSSTANAATIGVVGSTSQHLEHYRLGLKHGWQQGQNSTKGVGETFKPLNNGFFVFKNAK